LIPWFFVTWCSEYIRAGASSIAFTNASEAGVLADSPPAPPA
jgi:hypothetical protein